MEVLRLEPDGSLHLGQLRQKWNLDNCYVRGITSFRVYLVADLIPHSRQ